MNTIEDVGYEVHQDPMDHRIANRPCGCLHGKTRSRTDMLLNPQHRLEEMQVAESGAYAMNANFDSFAACAAIMCMAVVLLAEMASPSLAAEPSTLIINARIFDGMSEKLVEGRSVLVEGHKIDKIAETIKAPANATVIDAGGRVLMPGLIDVHWHTMLATLPMGRALQSDLGYLTLVGAQASKDALLRGFTSLRDLGGNVFAIKKAIDEGLIAGPRIYPSGAFISQTSGHGDFLGPHDVPTQAVRQLSYFEQIGVALERDEHRASYAVYAEGFFGDGARKSMEPIAARACPDTDKIDAQHQGIQHFITDSN